MVGCRSEGGLSVSVQAGDMLTVLEGSGLTDRVGAIALNCLLQHSSVLSHAEICCDVPCRWRAGSGTGSSCDGSIDGLDSTRHDSTRQVCKCASARFLLAHSPHASPALA